MPKNYSKEETEGKWITVHGRHILVKDGESVEDALARSDRAMGKKPEESKEKESSKKKDEDQTEEYKDTFDVDSLGHLEVGGDSIQEFIRANKQNKEFMQFGKDHSMEAVEQLRYTVQHKNALKHEMREMKIEDAISQVRDNIKASHMEGWFREGNSDYKPKIAEQLLSDPKTLNSAYNIAYENYKNSTNKPLPFKEWLVTSQTMYRGTSGQTNVKSDVFSAWTPDKKIAENFAFGKGGAVGSQHGGEGKIHSMKIRPIDTWGSLQTTGEQEFMVPTTLDSFEDKKRRK